MRTLLKNCKILKNNKLSKTNILIENSKIKEVTKKSPKANYIINIKNKIVLPGIIDPHVHVREPGLTHKEDFLTAGIAAAMGGITTIMDMPNTIPPTTTLKALEQKRKLANKAIVNVLFHFGSSKNNLNHIKNAKNIASVKVYMDLTTGDLKVDDKVLYNILKTTKLTAVHAEGINVLKAINFAKNTKSKLYLCHISSEEEIKMINAKRTNNIFVEVTPHHLFLTEKDYKKNKKISMKPELKTKKDQNALWQGVKEGLVDTIGTDHAPHTLIEKTKACFGVPGLDTLVPLLLDAVNKKKLTLEKMIELTSTNAAKIFNLNKGKIEKGYDADLTVVDLNLKKKVHSKELLTKCRWSPWEGHTLKGWPIMTIVMGKIVFCNSKHLNKG